MRVKKLKQDVQPPIKKRRRKRFITEEADEAAAIELARKLARQKLMDGTAPAAVIVHYLRLGTEEYKSDLEKAKAENKLLKAKTELVESAKRESGTIEEAIEAMKLYSGKK